MMKNNDDEIIYEYVRKIFCILKQDISVLTCDDTQCDNEDCVLFRAVNQYIKYTPKPEKNKPL